MIRLLLRRPSETVTDQLLVRAALSLNKPGPLSFGYALVPSSSHDSSNV